MLKFEWTKEHTVALIYTCVTILLAIPLVLVILFPDILGGALGGLVDALSPVLIGFAVAYLLFPVCNFFEKKVCGFIEKKKPRPRLRRIAAVVLTLLAATAFLVFFVWMLVPQIKASYLNLEATFDTYLKKASVYLGEVTAKYTEPGTEPVFDSAALLDTVGGWIDSLISRVMEIFQAFPDLIFAMAIMTFMGKGVLNLFIALGLLTWVRTARMIRGSVMQLKEKEYVEAARACGASTYWIIMKELVPNCLSTIIVLVTLGIPNAIMYEASLSFLGIGIQPPTPSWGNMISAAQTFISYRPVYSIMPGVAIMITVIAFNIFGDGLRDALDPKLRS